MQGETLWNKPSMAESAVATFLYGPIADSHAFGDEGDSVAENFDHASLVADVRVWMIWFLSNQENLPAVELIRLYGVKGAALVVMGQVSEEDKEALKLLGEE